MPVLFFVWKLYAGVGREAAVNGQHNAGDEACSLIIQQEQQAAGQILGLAEAAHGGAGQDLLGALGGGAVLIEQQGLILLGSKEAGSNGVDTDVALGEVDSQPLGKLLTAAFAPE